MTEGVVKASDRIGIRRSGDANNEGAQAVGEAQLVDGADDAREPGGGCRSGVTGAVRGISKVDSEQERRWGEEGRGPGRRGRP